MRDPECQLAFIAMIFLTMGSSFGQHPCSTNYSDNADWLMDHCESTPSTFHLICYGDLHGEWKSGSGSVHFLTLCGWPEESLDPEDLLSKFPALRNLSIIDSNVTHLVSGFPGTATDLEVVTFGGTSLEELPRAAFSNLQSLRILDLRNNALRFVDPTAIEGQSLQYVYLSGNPFNCASEMTWILNSNNESVASRVVDRDKLTCTLASKTDHPLVQMMEITAEVADQCQKTVCSCDLTYVVSTMTGSSNRKQLLAFVTVNCSSKGLTELPEFLPQNTTTLHLAKNKIRDLTPLTKNPVYRKVIDLYLDDNEVESIAILEGSDWLDHFRAFSLRGNRLSYVPPYVIENALQQNDHPVAILLGKNPWRCDCHFTPGFQVLLRSHTGLFKDVEDVTCAEIQDDENSGKQISHLSRTAICTSPDQHWIQPLDILNVVLASLIFFVLGKLLYDYWTFKKTGKLPWIVAKMP
ncbi:protein singed wings 2 [Neodiprion virginianus]|uniref:protein singed wings 2 n=1 Tax=Neodiprion virginianus TaxID=2961670 RepID=UPI001EE725DC|nr:protein singed wings 2 [Neodiprion virginianus]